mgnify:CR=1 FL=1
MTVGVLVRKDSDSCNTHQTGIAKGTGKKGKAKVVGCIVSGLEGLKEANTASFAEISDLLLKVLSRLEAGVRTLEAHSNSEAEPELEEEPEAEAEVKAG